MAEPVGNLEGERVTFKLSFSVAQHHAMIGQVGETGGRQLTRIIV